MVWDVLATNGKEYEDRMEFDIEAKWYGVLHHFFADLHHVAYVVEKLYSFFETPYSDKHTDFIVISVPTDAESDFIPAIIVEGGTVSASFDLHNSRTVIP